MRREAKRLKGERSAVGVPFPVLLGPVPLYSPWVRATLPFPVPGVQRGWIPANAFSVYGPHLYSRSAPVIDRTLHFDYGRIKPEAVAALTAYQKAGLDHALPERDFLFFWTVGAGKTLASLIWGLAPAGVPLLYVTRASARLQVASEIAKWTTAKVQILAGESPNKRIGLVPGKRKAAVKGTVIVPDEDVFDPTANIYLLTYDTLSSWIAHLETQFAGQTFSLVWDELHRLKGWRRSDPGAREPAIGWRIGATRGVDEDGEPLLYTKPNLAWSAMRLSRIASRRLGVTGTPVRDRPRDLWAELDVVSPRSFGSNYEFVARYCDARPNQWGGLDTNGTSNETELRMRIDTFCHRVSHAQVRAQAMAKRRSTIRVPAEDLLPVAKLPPAIASLLSDIDRAKHVATQIAVASARKAPAVVEFVTGLFDGEDGPPLPLKVVVFTWLRADCDRLAADLTRTLAPVTVLSAHGGTAADERNRLREVYMSSPGPIVLVGTGDAWGEAVNLQDTDHAIFAGLPFTPGQIEQWEGRFSRVGQTRPVCVTYVVGCGTADEHVASLLLDKLPAAETFSGLGGTQGVTDHLYESLGMDDEEATDRLMSMIVSGEKVA